MFASPAKRRKMCADAVGTAGKVQTTMLIVRPTGF
jgi:hypothetical protein